MNPFNPTELKATRPLFESRYSTITMAKDGIFKEFITRQKINTVIPANDNRLPAQMNRGDPNPHIVRPEPVAYRNTGPIEIERARSPTRAMPVITEIDRYQRDILKAELLHILLLVDADNKYDLHSTSMENFFRRNNKQNRSAARFWQLIETLSYRLNLNQPVAQIEIPLSFADIKILISWFDICWSLLEYKNELYGFFEKDLKVQKIAIGNIILAGEQAFYDLCSNGKKLFVDNYEFNQEDLIDDDEYDYTKRSKRIDDALESQQNKALGFFKAIDAYFETGGIED